MTNDCREKAGSDTGQEKPAGEMKERAPRTKRNVRISFKRGGGYPVSGADLIDISRTGCKIEATAGFAVEDQIWVHVPGLSAVSGKVAWCENFFVGIKFDRELPDYIFEDILRRLG